MTYCIDQIRAKQASTIDYVFTCLGVKLKRKEGNSYLKLILQEETER